MKPLSKRALFAFVFAQSAAAASPPATKPECLIRGENVVLEQVTVKPSGAAPFEVGLRGAKLNVKLPTASGKPAVLEAAEPIAFRAEHKNLWLRVAEDFVSDDGLVRLRRGARLVRARVEGGMVVGSAVLYSNDVLEGEDKEPDEVASEVRLPCRGVMLGTPGRGRDHEETEERKEGGGGSSVWYEPRKPIGRVELRSRPDRGAPSIAVTTLCDECGIELRRVREQGEWILGERTGEGVTIRGWVPRAAFTRIPEDVGLGRSYMCMGNHGRRTFMGGDRWGPGEPPAGLYEGEARIRSGARVFSSPPDGEWAVFTAEAKVGVRFIPGREFAQLTQMPGLDFSQALGVVAVVRAEDVILPAGKLVEGVLLDAAGRPAPNARLTIVQSGAEGEHTIHRELTTDARGRFSSPGFAPRPVRISSYIDKGDQVAWVRVDPSADLVIRLERRWIATGRVLDPDGAPVTKFEVNNQKFNASDGRFRWREQTLPAKRQLWVRAEGYAPVMRRGAESGDFGDLRLERGRTVRGQVTFEGAPVVDAKVSIAPEPWGSYRWENGLWARGAGWPVSTDAEGRFELHHVPTEDGYLHVLSAGHLPFEQRLAGSDDSPKELRLERGASVTVQVLEATGKPARASIRLFSSTGESVHEETSTRADGTTTYAGLVPGRWTVVAGVDRSRKKGGARHVGCDPVTLDLGPGADESVVLRVPTGGVSVELEFDPAPPEGERIDFVLYSGSVPLPSTAFEHTALDLRALRRPLPGTTQLQHVAPGAHTLMVFRTRDGMREVLRQEVQVTAATRRLVARVGPKERWTVLEFLGLK